MPITLRSRFTPLTYDEITKPLIEQTQAQNELEDKYMEISDKASQIMTQANSQTDPESYRRLKQYSEDLQKEADSLITGGLSNGSRRNLMQLRKRYGRDILPIESAINRRYALGEEWRKLRVQDPTLMVERNPLSMSLDEIVRNPNIDYGNTISGKSITDRVGKAVSAVAKGIQKISLGQPLDNYTKTMIQQSGFTPEEIMNAINGGADPNSILISVRDNVIQSTGANSWLGESDKQKLLNYANEGLYYGVGETKITPFDDFGARENLKFQHQLALLQERENKEKGKSSGKPAFPQFDTEFFETKSEEQDAFDKNKELQKYIQDGLLAVDNEGKVSFTDAGLKKYKKVDSSPITGMPRYTEFQRFLSNNNLVSDNNGNIEITDNINTILDRGKYDKISYRGFKRLLDSTTYPDVIAKLNSSGVNDDGEIYNYEIVRGEDGHADIKKSEKVNVSDLKPENIKSVNVVHYDRLGSNKGKYYSKIVTDTKGTILLPISNETTLRDIGIYENIIEELKKTDKKNPRQLIDYGFGPSTISDAISYYRMLISDAQIRDIAMTVKTKEEEVK